MADMTDTASAVAGYLDNNSAQLGAQARMSMLTAVGSKPEYEAELQSVAKRTGVPLGTVRSYPDEMKKQATLGAYDFDRMAEQFPNATRFLADQDKAAVGHDDTSTLKSVEQGFGSLLKFAMGNGPNQGFIGPVKAAPFVAAGAFAGVKRAAVDLVEPFARVVAGPDNLFARSSALYGQQAAEFAAQAKAVNPPQEGIVAGGLDAGGNSLVQNAKYLPLALFGGPPGAAIALGGMAAETFGQSYNKAADKGVPLGTRVLYAAADGVIEWGTEKGPLGALIHNVKAGTPFFQSVISNAWKENKGEQVATLLQNLNEWGVLNPDKPFSDFVKEIPAEAAKTLIATLVGAGGNTAIAQGSQNAVDMVTGRNRQAEYMARIAEERALLFEGLQKTAEASKLLERSPDTLRSYMQDIADQGVPNVFLDAGALKEAGVDMQALAQVVPSLATQMEQVETGGDLVVPTSELLVNTVGAEYAQTLIDHARTSEDAMSRAEAKVFMQEQGDQLNAEIERVLTERANDQEFKAGRDALQAQIQQELDSVKRFTPAVNQQYAALTANYYAVMAARSGMTVEQFAQTYKLGFAGQAGVGGQVLDQATQVRPRLRAIAESAQLAGNQNQTVELFPVSDGVISEARQHLNIDLTGYKHTVDMFSVRHALNRHGDAKVEASRGQLPLTADDIASLADVIETPDARVYGAKTPRKQHIVASIKRMPDGSLLVVEEVRTGRKTLALTSARKFPAAKDFDSISQTLLSNAQSDGGEGLILVDTPAGGNYDPANPNILKQSVSTRVPTAVKALENPLADMLVIGLEASKADRKAFEKNVAVVVGYSNYRDAPSANTPDKQAERFINHVRDNLLWLHDQVDETTRDRSKLWYDGARAIVDRWAPKFGYTDAQVSGVLAVLSPQKDWFMNVSLGERILDAMANQQNTPWSEEMTAKADVIFAKEKYATTLASIKGKTLAEITDPASKAMWIRTFDEAHNNRNYRLVTPEGDFADFVVNSDGETRSKAGWGSLPEIAKAVSILEDGSMATISGKLGGQHKVRNFYNNLFNPKDTHGSVTIDTHAVAAGLLRPLSGTSIEVEQNFGGSGSASSSEFGAQGTYGLYAEAYRRAAQARGILPREMQSITWEAVRGLFTAGFKGQAKNVDAIAAVWETYKSKRISLDEARTQIDQLAGGINPPDWVGSAAGADARSGDSSYASELSGDGLPRGGAGTVPGRAGAGAADGTAGQPNTLEQAARGQISFGDDITKQASIISMLKGADLSTFIHESGHFFLEVQADLAARISARIDQGETVSEGERSILDDMNKLLDWMGVKATPTTTALGEWLAMPLEQKRPHHETFARGFEAYAFEGKAPSLDLQKTFQTFRAWLVNVYRTVKDALIGDVLNVQLTDEVRSVMDRMLATTDQINEAEASRNMGPLFKTAEQAGMTAEQYKDYHDQGVQATLDAIDALQAKGLKDMQWLQNARSRKLKELQKEHDALRREITMQVRAEVMAQPIYRAWTYLTAKAAKPMEPGQAKIEADKEIADHKQRRVEAEEAAAKAEREKLYAANPEVKGLQRGQLVAKNKRQIGINVDQAMLDWDKANPAPEKVTEQQEPTDPVFATGKLNTEDLRKAYGKADDAVWRKLSALRMTSEENGVHPDIVAELFGFSSGDEMVKALAEAEPPKSVIEGMTDQRMLEENGDMATPAGLERAADAAIHNDARARFVATELAALQKAMSVREKVPGQRSTVDVLARAARDYADAIIARIKVRDIRPGQYTAAEVRASKAAQKASGDLAQATMHKRNQLINMYAAKAAFAAQDEVKKAIDYFKKFDTVSKSLDFEYQDQIHALLERFDLRKGVSLKALDKRASLVEWVQSQIDQGMEPNIPPELLQEANRKSFKDMTVEEVRGLRDTIAQIEHLGRLKNKLLTSQANRDFAAVVDEISASIDLHAGDRQANTRTPNTLPALALIKLKNFWASHIKAATWARVMDGGKDGGPVWEYLIRTANAAGDREVVMREKATKALAALAAPVLAQGKMGGKGTFYPSVGRSLNREAVITIALNMGNDGNTQRLLGGEGWTLDQIRPVLDSLTATDWTFVQAVWDHFETYRPEIGAKEKRIYGKEPNWVEPRPVQTPFGVLRGGYYPIKYDPRASERAESHEEAEDAKRLLGAAYTSATTRRSFTKARVEEVSGRPLLLSMDGIYNGVQEVIHDLTWHEWLIDANKLVKNKKISQAMREKYGPDVHQQFKRWLEDNAAGDRGAQDAGEMAASWVRQGVSVSGLGLNILSAAMQPLGLTQSIVRIGPKWVGKGIGKMLGSPLDTVDEVNGKSEFMRTRSLTQLREIAEVRSQVKGRTKTREVIDGSAYFLMMRAQQLVDVPTWWGAYEKATAEGNDEARSVALADQAVIDSQGSGGTKDQSAIERGGPYLKLFTTFYSFFNTALNLGVQSTMTESNKAKLAANYLLLYSAPAILGAALKDALTPGDSGDWDEEKILKRLIGEQISFLFGLMVGVREMAGAAQAVTGTAQYSTDYSGPAGVRFLGDLVKLGKQIQQGEMDEGLRKAIINTAGELLRLPSAQINRTITGIQALNEGKTTNPGAIFTGYQEPK